MSDVGEYGAVSEAVAEQFTFASVVEPVSVERFMNDYRGKGQFIQHGPPDRFDWLLSWRSLNALIRDQRPAAPRFRLMNAGNSLPEGTYQRTVQTLRGPLRQLDPARLLAANPSRKVAPA